MTPSYQDDLVTLYHGDCLDVLKALADDSVDAVVTDPPYGLAFMGKKWDDHVDGVKFGRWCQTWAAECLRVLKPGGHLLAFGGTRTAHRLACAIEDAGFEIRDMIAWLYGSGFPKSLDVAKAIDKAAGAAREPILVPTKPGNLPEQAGEIACGATGMTDVSKPVTEAAQTWQGWGTALKPANEPIIVARKAPTGPIAANVLAHGTGALNIDACRVEAAQDYRDKCASVVGLDSNHDGAAYGEFNRRREDSSSPLGRWPANVVLDENAAAELDQQTGVRRSSGVYDGDGSTRPGVHATNFGGDSRPASMYDDEGGASRFFPTFRYEAKAPATERPRIKADGQSADTYGTRKRCALCGKQEINSRPSSMCSCPAPQWEADPSQQGYIAHPTVKPLDLMRWLVRLVTPPGGVVLEPFAGSGTTAEACIVEGFRCIAIEREADYLPLILARITKPIEPVLDFGEAS